MVADFLKNNLNYKEYDHIISRSGSGSINEILYHTNNVTLFTLSIKRQASKFKSKLFSIYNMSLKIFQYLIKNFISEQILTFINPYSLKKLFVTPLDDSQFN